MQQHIDNKEVSCSSVMSVKRQNSSAKRAILRVPSIEDKKIGDDGPHRSHGQRDHKPVGRPIEPEPKSDRDQCQGAGYLKAACPRQFRSRIINADKAAKTPNVP